MLIDQSPIPVADVEAWIAGCEDLVAMHGPFALTSTGVAVLRPPTFEEWQAAVKWCHAVHEASPFWVGDLVNYGEAKWGERYSQALEASGYAYQTLRNVAVVSRAIDKDTRNPKVPFAHHQEVAPLTPAEQKEWLDRCESEGLTREKLRAHLKARRGLAAGKTVEYFVLVTCRSVEDQTDFAERMRVEGREALIQVKTIATEEAINARVDVATGSDGADGEE